MKNWLGKALFLALLLAAGWQVEKIARPVLGSAQLERPRLILDAGHGGEDGGAVSRTGVPESGINLSIVLKMDALLGLYGEEPVLVRDTNRSIHDQEAQTLRQKKNSDLKNRVKLVEETPNGVLLSIHQNIFTDPKFQGAQVFFRPDPDSQALAGEMQEALRQADPENRRKPAQIASTIYLMNHVTRPAVLVECGFLSHPVEEQKLLTGEYQTQLALCMTAAWLRWQQNWG